MTVVIVRRVSGSSISCNYGQEPIEKETSCQDIKEEHRLQFEKHTQNLKKIKSEVQDKIEKKETSEISSSAEGMHEAIQDIVKAMQDLKNYLF
jgi:hypothetical protein